MRVLQLIDSLNAGGAERMAVGYANALSTQIEGSHLCVTREEGILKETVSPSVGYLFLNKKKTFDNGALLNLKNYIKENKITIIHAHTTSYFFAILLKLRYPSVKVIWHEHQGNRVKMQRKDNRALYFCSLFFSAIFTVNEELTLWCRKHLSTKKVEYIPNFVQQPSQVTAIDDRKEEIICVANLKAPKNHLNLLKAFNKVHLSHPNWKLILVGRKEEGSYLVELKNFISENNLNSVVNLLGERADVMELMNRASIGVLSSDNEGLPVALLEYGMCKLAVVTTDVGHCSKVINGYGKVVDAGNYDALANGIIDYITNDSKRKKDASEFYHHIEASYSVTSVLPKIISLYKEIAY
ncbi:glycosyltransferase [Ulvibacter antarcticus]|uniref:Glycosyltransferase involved in cell wall biosynthesis n=1 Tax=Ulvibacter antarcticus TaxID=442714 RepID=A0A3L9YU50_9FLAO|nr:glycosyltransferase [Ulvibacter antarcticus]RMA57992.1 glycosyltransferase involved in cell wall biosynthesis [Ulvibacter antarcticus]